MTKKIFSKPQAVIGLVLIGITLLERISLEDASFHVLYMVQDML